ncbi:hypothetical protein FSHL1_004966 [Fusarium sambucinum]
MLCQKCQELLVSSVEVSGSDDFPHQTCIEDWKHSVDTRCMICATIWFQFTPDEQRKFNQLEGYEFGTFGLISVFVSEDDNSDFYLEFELGPDAAEISGISRQVLGFKAHKETDKEKSLGHDSLILDSLQFSATTNSPKVFSLAKKWISQCLEKHPSCNESNDARWYPTRLLSFTSSGEAKDPMIYLEETNAVTPSGPYMTLSHSWGEGHTITLDRKSYQNLLRGIPLSSLPPTFCDACVIARQVGVDYIWIDALCIFQDKDDLSDWNREASLMHKVYSFSHCNIVAAENINSSEPIFRNRNPESLIPPTTTTLVQKGLSSSEFEERSESHKYIIDYSGYWDPVTDAHIYTRGWVMQERFLSPRALHIGAHQVYWECREFTASETNHSGFEILYDGDPFKSLINAPYGHYSWSSLVIKYSGSALSFPSDKLVAFSAIARLYSYYLSDDYVAGMWRSHLQGGLLWWAYAMEVIPTRYEVYVAPTWSWASIEGRVITANYESDRVEYVYGVDGYKLEYATEDNMGAVRSGWLRLKGQLRELKLLRKATESKEMWSLFIDNLKYDPQQYGDGETGDLWSSVWLDEPQTGFDEESKSGALYCMLARHHLFNDAGDAYNMWDFLLFQLVDSSQGIFRWIGMARTRTGKVKSPYPMSNLTQEDSPESTLQDGSDTTTLPCASYEGGLHSIYVI